jgi:phosphate-selective porin OprO/OprP
VKRAVLALCAIATPAAADEPTRTDTIDAGESDREPVQKPTDWNEYDLNLLTVRVGAGLLLDFADFDQNAASKEQMVLESEWRVRDARFVFKGHFWFLPERVGYSLGYMYDGPTRTWHFRQTGILIKVPELNGSLFVGRQKEGFSTNKITTGYYGWTMERSAASDAFIPILADGVTWTGSAGDHIVYNAGGFLDEWSETEGFNRNDNQVVMRVVYLPLPKEDVPLLHLAVEARHGSSNNGFLQFRSKPEAFPAQSYAVDTGKFAAEATDMVGFEAYLIDGPLMLGSEYYINRVTSPDFRNPVFNGGDVVATYLITGETRPYNEKGAFFEAITPKHSVFDHGTGAVEVVLRYSQVNLDSAGIAGGRFWRITPQINWYLSRDIRFEIASGYSMLHRFGIDGETGYLQVRIQLTQM